MRLALLGVRGSTPAPGAPFVRYGGHTSCVAVLDDSSPVPRLVLDAGTGVRELSGLLGGRAYRGAVVLSHLHWDHVHGLPFSPALDHPDSQVELWVPGNAGGDSGRGFDLGARGLLASVMSPPHFPIDPGGLLGSWRFRLASPGRLALDEELAGGARVEVAPVRHKGGTTFAVRVDLDGASIAYVPDHTLSAHTLSTLDGDPVTSQDAAAVELAHGVDLLLHDGQFVGPDEARLAADYGHSTIEDALRWADRCQVGQVVLTHHAPARTDDALDALADRFRKTSDGRPVTFAAQGHTLAI